ncbi:hypothetical protein JNUCC1_00910 [Lentibacillus sp. JNUCC-1]|uniref:DnaJ domain-containing protein n=1 Tax=Lentibacillus sp. JNUCC-1 TaxID=2654513 RepID=UPI0012E984FF|nr:DnaJ domain-containing protein [Lentibacillus sp. JNUCC-1]MUV37104.1 hypothetical protein [Lentibacillus sp. JNUCC-1]
MSKQDQSYYKILGTTANISQRRIKEKYISAVKQHPPETDPEQFEKIREAYDTLKDPVKRKQYDLSRKYGGDIEKMLEKADKLTINENYEKAEKVLLDVLQIDPDILSAQLGVIFVRLRLNQINKAHQMLEKLLSSPALYEDEDLTPAMVYAAFGKVLIDLGHIDEAIHFLEQGVEQFSDEGREINDLLTITYLDTGQDQKAIETAEKNVPPADLQPSIDDFDRYVNWLYAILNTNSWPELSKVKARFRKYLKNLQDPQEREEAFSVLSTEYVELSEVYRYRDAEVFLELATVTNPQDQDAKSALKEAKQLARAEKEIGKLVGDETIFPLMIYHSVHWFYNDDDYPLVRELDYLFNSEAINALKAETDFYAAGILKLQKNYPVLYNMFKSEWDALYQDLTKHMNREAKRELKKLM